MKERRKIILGYIEDIRKLVGHRPLILVGAVVVMLDDKGRILLQQRKFPKESWGLPGGLMELGESLEYTAKREVLEETGLIIEDLKLLDIFSGPDYYIKVSNGDKFYSVTAVYYTRNVNGDLVIDYNESETMEYFSLLNLPDGLTNENRSFIESYITKLIKI